MWCVNLKPILTTSYKSPGRRKHVRRISILRPCDHPRRFRPLVTASIVQVCSGQSIQNRKRGLGTRSHCVQRPSVQALGASGIHHSPVPEEAARVSSMRVVSGREGRDAAGQADRSAGQCSRGDDTSLLPVAARTHSSEWRFCGALVVEMR